MPATVSCPPGAAGPVSFAARELERYLRRMLPDTAQPAITLAARGDEPLDGYTVQLTPQGGAITGANPRSVLLGVYAALHALGCRFLGPGAAREVVPTLDSLSPVSLRCAASYRHRGVCIEGADSLENVLDFVDWLPKVGFNTFFLQFKNPYAFLKRWYHHERNPLLPPVPFTPQDAAVHMARIEAQVRERGLLLHKAGHGWTGEVLGYPALDWDADPAPLDEAKRPLCAQVKGVRGLWQGIPANTNLCFSDPRAADALAENVVRYARDNPGADYLHVWLADEYNNICECDACQTTTLADQYVALLNEIDRRLTAQGLRTRLVFLLYQELLWPPIRERLRNPDRFLLMFAPISRTFRASYDLAETAPIPPFRRNRVTLPTSLAENLALLRGWQGTFSGESFIYDYPLGRAHYGDLGYVHISRVIHGDIRRLREMGLDGYISCQELRAGCPNFLPNYVMGRTLLAADAPVEELIGEYFTAAYGSDAPAVGDYLEALSACSDCDYFNGIGPRTDPAVAGKMVRAQELCRAFARDVLAPKEFTGGRWWGLLAYHNGYVLRLARALEALAKGEDAAGPWRDFARYVRENELLDQPELDVYRVLEVGERYTGFPHPDT